MKFGPPVGVLSRGGKVTPVDGAATRFRIGPAGGEGAVVVFRDGRV